LQIVEAFARGLQALPFTGSDARSTAMRHAFRIMFLLHAVSLLRSRSGHAMAARVVRGSDFTHLGTLQGLLCAALRRDAVNLVDSWQFSDARLDSTLGRSDGKYVEALFEAAKQEPLNASAVSDGYTRHLKHIINREPSLPVSEDGRLIDHLGDEEITRSKL
jgi:acyl-CoA oxidase